MYPTPEDVLAPSRWLRQEFDETRIAFRRDDMRLMVSAVRRRDRHLPPTLSSGPCWELRCRQRAGEATDDARLGYVPTRERALDTLLRYMDRLNETIEDDGGLVPRSTIESLGGSARTVDDGRGRPSTERSDVDTLIQ